MRKRAVGLLLSATLSLSLFGCGNEEPKQEEVQEVVQEDVEVDAGAEQEEVQQEEQEVEQENDYSDLIGKEFENDDIYIKIENTDQLIIMDTEFEKAYGQLEADQDIPIYCDGGFQIGHIKQGAVIDITEHGYENEVSSAYYRFENPISELPFDYLYVSYLDCNYELFKVETESSLKEKEEREQGQEEETSPYDEILAKVSYDKDKTYTSEEYIEVLTNIFKEMGKEYNSDVEKDFIDYNKNNTTFDGYHVMMSYYTFDFSDHEKTLENTKSAMSYVDYGLDGMSNITEFAIAKGQMNGEETINIYIKVVH